MPRITEIFAFVAQDSGPEDEGLAAFRSTMGWMPLIGADAERVAKLREAAQEVATRSGKTLRLVRFSVREELDLVEPGHEKSALN